MKATVQTEMDQLGRENNNAARRLTYLLDTGTDPVRVSLTDVLQRNAAAIERANRESGLQTAVFLGSGPLAIDGLSGHLRSSLRPTSWLLNGSEDHQRFLVIADGKLYVLAADRQLDRLGRAVLVMTSRPVNRSLADALANKLGRVVLVPALAGNAVRRSERGMPPPESSLLRGEIGGGQEAPRANLLDVGVRFLSMLPVTQWESGQQLQMPMHVESRPSLLFEALFGSGLTGRISDTVRVAFLSICFLFAFIEALALYMALRLTRTMTQSVEALYDATLHVDRGDLQHRIGVERQDQLADLCRSFNRMSWSLGRLLLEQKEKERMQSELSIAQEVQANLFPLSDVRLPTLELHGVCRPARTVSGDYYDFLLFHEKDSQQLSGLGLALGDISGKGISAALLMATLHSAVRAYQFASEELLTPAARLATGGGSVECSEVFESPGHVLALLNRHLFRSTQPEKYATLFLAHYHCASARLTYANAGQLPPLVLCANGTLHRLDRGGTVVGLMDNMQYDEGSLTLRSGDLVIAYSDGVTEPENDFGDFGEDRLVEVVRQFRDEPLERISSEVMRALDAWIGDGEQPDDITLVLARQI